MNLPKSIPLTVAILLASLCSGTSVNAQVAQGAQNQLPQIQRFLVQHMLLLGRSFLDFTYEYATIEPGTNTLVLSGLKFYPPIDLEQDLECEISVDQITVDGTYGLNEISIGWEMIGTRVPNSCFGPEARDALTGAGYENILFDIASIDVGYSLPDSSAGIVLRLTVRDAVVFEPRRGVRLSLVHTTDSRSLRRPVSVGNGQTGRVHG